jgi:hypothetical protein
MKHHKPFSPPVKRRLLLGAGRSQGMVEFALALPILLMLLFAIIDFSLLFSAWLLIQNISRQAVRYAVTGEYDVANCTAGCATVADQDQARFQSINDEADSYRAGLLVEDAATISDPGYLLITICSSRDLDGDGNADFVTIFGRMGSGIYSECLDAQDAGGPGDEVVVMVDFNHPYITPFLNDVWPMVHLFSAHRGIVEQFRVSRLINLNPGLNEPTPTASFTYTPSETYTPSPSFTPSTTASLTPTPTATNTITPSPTPDCNQFTFTTSAFNLLVNVGKPRAYIAVRNSSLRETYIQSMTFTWDDYDAEVPTQIFNRFYFGGALISDTDDSSSPTSWFLVGLPAAGHKLAPGATNNLSIDFKNADAAFPGNAHAITFGINLVLGNGCVLTIDPQAAPTHTMTRTPTSTRTITATPTASSTGTRTATATTTGTGTNTPTASLTGTRTNTPTASLTGTRTNTPTITRTPTVSQTITRTPTITYTPTISQTPTKTATPTRSNTPTISSTPSNTATPTVSRTFTPTASRTSTPTISNTPSRTATNTFTPTRSNTWTATVTPTRSNTPTNTRTPTSTSTPTPNVPTPTRTRTPSATPTDICFDC